MLHPPLVGPCKTTTNYAEVAPCSVAMSSSFSSSGSLNMPMAAAARSHSPDGSFKSTTMPLVGSGAPTQNATPPVTTRHRCNCTRHPELSPSRQVHTRTRKKGVVRFWSLLSIHCEHRRVQEYALRNDTHKLWLCQGRCNGSPVCQAAESTADYLQIVTLKVNPKPQRRLP